MEGRTLRIMIYRRPKMLTNLVSDGHIPFNFSQKKVWKYMCSDCRALFDFACDFQYHVETKHPAPKKEKKEKKFNPKPPREKLRAPDARERKQLREAIAEGKNRRLYGL